MCWGSTQEEMFEDQSHLYNRLRTLYPNSVLKGVVTQKRKNEGCVAMQSVRRSRFV